MFIFCILVSCGIGKEQFDSREAKAQLYQFYHDYITGLDSAHSSTSFSRVMDSIERVHCTTELKRQLDEDTKSGKLDWDPFVKAQDINVVWLKTIQVKEDSATSSFIVSYLDEYSQKWVRIYIKMTIRQGRYQISDVDYFK